MVLALPSISSTKGVCEGCKLGKHHKEMFNKGKVWCAKEQLQLIHTNKCGPFKTPSLSHVVYFLTFINHHNGKPWVYFLNHKSETFGIFQEFKSMVENKFDKSIKTLRTDNRGNSLKRNLLHIYVSMEFNVKRLFLIHLNKTG